MSRVRRLAVIGLLLVGGSVAAQDRDAGWRAPDQAIDEVRMPGTPVPASEFPDAEAVFEKYIEAIGGRDAVFGVRSRRFVGTVTFTIRAEDGSTSGQSGRVVSAAEAPNKFVQDVIFPGLRSDRTIYDGEHGWRTDDQGGVTVIEGEELSRLRNSAVFHQVADYDRLFSTYEVVGGVEQDDGTRLVRVQVEFPSGRDEAYVFDDETGLLVAVISDRAVGDGQRASLLRMYFDYEDSDGVMYPRVTTERYGNVFLRFEIAKIETGIDLPDYEVPDEVAALK